MAAMKSSTVSSLRVLVVTFLKASPALRVVAADGAPRPCAATRNINPKPPDNPIATAAVTTSRNQSFMFISSVRVRQENRFKQQELYRSKKKKGNRGTH